jgi:hypothetical protein
MCVLPQTHVSHYIQRDGFLVVDMFSRAKTHGVQFAAVVNPCLGPCDATLPEQNYIDKIPKLQTLDNIKTLGYVATTYAGKELNRMLAEIDKYAN